MWTMEDRTGNRVTMQQVTMDDAKVHLGDLVEAAVKGDSTSPSQR